MTPIPIAAGEQAWLRSCGLVDPELDLSAVRLSTAGLPAWWVRRRGRSAITIGSRIWFAAEPRLHDRALLVHELVHVAQYRELGLVGFLARYGWHLVRAGFRYSAKLPLEAPAYARQREARALLAAEAEATVASSR